MNASLVTTLKTTNFAISLLPLAATTALRLTFEPKLTRPMYFYLCRLLQDRDG